MKKKEILTGVLTLTVGYLFAQYLKCNDGPIVEVENGFIRGIISDTDGYHAKYKAFYGIPYAEPPIGNLRFEPPVPASNWTGIKDATSYRSQCLQSEILFSGLIYGREDCLFLNVFAPHQVSQSKQHPSKIPVMVFIHGGYWHVGASQDHGEKRLMNENIVLVTFNYRLGAFGFLSTGDSVVPGNQGLKDQVMALKWVQRNIKQFGGDPNQVTLFGESVGGVAVQFHILSPNSKGLFHRAISQSATAINLFAKNNLADVKAQSKNFAEKFSCPVDNSMEMVKCLKKLDAFDIVHAHKETLDLFRRNRLSMFAPTVEVIKDEQAFLTEEPMTILEKGNFPKIPWIAGINANEGKFSSAVVAANKTKQKILLDDWRTGLPRYLWYNRDDVLSQKIRDYYFKPSMTKEEFKQNITSALSDSAFFHPLHKAAELYSKHAETYLYYMNHSSYHSLQHFFTDSESSGFEASNFRVLNMILRHMWRHIQEFVLGWPVVTTLPGCHGDELPLLFTLPWVPSIFYTLPERDAIVSKHFIKLWTSFAKSCDSLMCDNVEWKSINSSIRPFRYLEISQNPRMIDEPFTAGVEFWESIQKDLLKARM